MLEIIKLDPLRRRIVDSFIELEKKLYNDCYKKVLSKEEVDELNERLNYDFLKKEYLQYNDEYYLVQTGKRNIGFFQIRAKDDEVEILKIYIDKKYQQNCYGYECFLKISDLAKKQNAKKIVIYVNEKLLESQKSFERWGFKFKEITARYLGSSIYLYENRYELDI